MRLMAAVTGNLRADMEREVRQTSAALRRAVTAAGRETQAELRAQARQAGFADGGRAVANTWRLDVYPRAGGSRTLRPAAMVSSRMPEIVDAFDRGAAIVPRNGRFLAIPTSLNREGGRRGGKPRVSVQQMAAAGSGAFVLPLKGRPGKLWCIRLRAASSMRGQRGRSRLLAFAGGTGVQLFTGRMRGQQANVMFRLAEGYAPMFILVPRVQLRKMVDVAGPRGQAAARLAAAMVRELGSLPA